MDAVITVCEAGGSVDREVGIALNLVYCGVHPHPGEIFSLLIFPPDVDVGIDELFRKAVRTTAVYSPMLMAPLFNCDTQTSDHCDGSRCVCLSCVCLCVCMFEFVCACVCLCVCVYVCV